MLRRFFIELTQPTHTTNGQIWVDILDSSCITYTNLKLLLYARAKNKVTLKMFQFLLHYIQQLHRISFMRAHTHTHTHTHTHIHTHTYIYIYIYILFFIYFFFHCVNVVSSVLGNYVSCLCNHKNKTMIAS